MEPKDHYVNRLRIDPVVDQGIRDYCAEHHIKRPVGTRQIIVAGLKALGAWPQSMLCTASGAEHTVLVDSPVEYDADGK